MTPAVMFTGIEDADVSFWQDNNGTVRKIDFRQMRTKSRSVKIRNGQNTWEDEDFAYNWAESKAQGFLRAVYWFWDSRSSPASQALRVYNLIKDDLPEMEVWADYEDTYGGPYGGWKNFAAFVGELQRLLPTCTIGIYVGYYYFKAYGPDPAKAKPADRAAVQASLDWFGQFPLWLPWYTEDVSIVKVPYPWTKPLWWQKIAKSGLGLEWGAESLDIDLNEFQGTEAEFIARYPGATIPEESPLPAQGVSMYKGLVLQKVNVRALPSASSSDVGDLLAGREVTGNEIQQAGGYNWLKLITPTEFAGRYAATGPVATPYSWIKITEEVPDPPTEPPTIYAEYRIRVMSDKTLQWELLP